MEEFIPMLVAFIILWIVLAKFGWPLFEGMLNKREETIKNSLEKSEEHDRKANDFWLSTSEQLDGPRLRLSRSPMPSSPAMLSERRSPLRLRLRQACHCDKAHAANRGRRRKTPSRTFRLLWPTSLLPSQLKPHRQRLDRRRAS